mmetsp:Transcript_84208/g.234885  ORF Transcript_84208/g.234885 Transcript_84208/m.234885 type:complete len:884 (-) Transcript_84208:96-2747(-)
MALRRAVEQNNVQHVKDLLSRGADVHQRFGSGEYTALHYAVTPQVAQLLLDANADPHEKSLAGTTPLQLAERRGSVAVVKALQEAEIDEGIRQERQESRRLEFYTRLKSALQCRGAADLNTLGELPEEVSIEFRQDGLLRNLMLRSCAVHEAEVLLGEKYAADECLQAKLVSSIQEDNIIEVQRAAARGADLLQRDAHGNVSAHHCVSLACYVKLAEREPRLWRVCNKQGHTPLDLLMEKCSGPEVVTALWEGGELFEQMGTTTVMKDDWVSCNGEGCTMSNSMAALLRLDDSGVSRCMRSSGAARKFLEATLPPWDDFPRHLKAVDSVPENLQNAYGCFWQELLAFHVFGESEVWKQGVVTQTCTDRLAEVWNCLSQLFKRVPNRTSEPAARKAIVAITALLNATRGPRKIPDPRGLYRTELSTEMQKLSSISEQILDVLHARMRGEAAEWLRDFPDAGTLSRLDPDGLLQPDARQDGRSRPRLRHDFQFRDEAKSRWGLVVPAWLRERLDVKQVLADLRSVGGRDLERCLGEVYGEGDAVYRMLEGKYGFGPESFPEDMAAMCDNSVVFWYCLWLRGVCQTYRDVVSSVIFGMLQKAEPPPSGSQDGDDCAARFFAPTEAKGLAEICHSALEEMHEALDEISASTLSPEAATDLMLHSPGFVTDALGVTFLVEGPAELKAAFECLRAGAGGVLRVENTLHRRAPSDNGCRELKAWVPVKVGKYGSVVAEVTLLLADSHREQQWSCMPREYFRGKFDYAEPERPQLKELPGVNPAFIPALRVKEPEADAEVDEETERLLREQAIRKAKEEADRLAQEEARKRREEVERKLREEVPDLDESDFEVRNNLSFRPPIEILPKTKRSEELQMKKLEKWNQKKSEQS